jgi:enoyl reductase-like protein
VKKDINTHITARASGGSLTEEYLNSVIEQMWKQEYPGSNIKINKVSKIYRLKRYLDTIFNH